MKKPKKPTATRRRKTACESNISVKAAYNALTAAMRKDPDYAHGWKCNIAMPIYDSLRDRVSHKRANEVADILMKHLFGLSPQETDPDRRNGGGSFVPVKPGMRFFYDQPHTVRRKHETLVMHWWCEGDDGSGTWAFHANTILKNRMPQK